MHDFHGWELAAAWEDTKFSMRHFHDSERLAMVGEKAWQHWMAVFCKPFTKADVRYFEASAVVLQVDGDLHSRRRVDAAVARDTIGA